MFQFLGPEMSFDKKLVFANLWLFGPLLEKTLAQSPPTNALLRTTLAPTMINAGIRDNVLPAKATAVVNLRVMPGESTTSVVEYVHRVIADPAVKILPLPPQGDPSPVFNFAPPRFRFREKTIRKRIPGGAFLPALRGGGPDSP